MSIFKKLFTNNRADNPADITGYFASFFIGKTSPDVFEGLKKMISSDLIKWFNSQHSDPASRGMPCKLTLGLKQRDGKELISWLTTKDCKA